MGTLRVVESPQEACDALTCLMRRQTGKNFPSRPPCLGAYVCSAWMCGAYAENPTAGVMPEPRH